MIKYHSVYRAFLLLALAADTGIREAEAATPPAYTVTDLGTLGGAGSAGLAINANGQVTGSADTLGNESHAFVWTPATPNGTSGTMKDLGTLGGTQGQGMGINASGQVTGVSLTTGDSNYHAFLYDGTMHDLGTSGERSSDGWGINSSGRVVGTSWNGAFTRSFVYDGTRHYFDQLPVARGINASGQIISQAGLWTPTTPNGLTGTLTPLGYLNELGFDISFNALNDNGQVTGAAGTIGVDLHAFVYDGTMHDLGTLGGPYANGYAINNRGDVTGESTLLTGYGAAFLYMSETGMVDLNTLISQKSGWNLTIGRGINDAGQITGYGFFGDEIHGFLLTPVPEPGALGVLAVAAAAASCRRGRRRGSTAVVPTGTGVESAAGPDYESTSKAAWHCGRFIRLFIFLAASLLAPVVAAAAAPLPVYGGPTYSSSAGGYVALHDSLNFAERVYVNNAGTAAATVFKYGSSGSPLGLRATRWSASSAAVELLGDPTSQFAQGINNAGTVIGQTSAQTGFPFPYNFQYRPARWASSGTAVTVLEHPYIEQQSAGIPVLGDINDAGTTVGLVRRSVRDQFNRIVDLGSRAGRWNGSGISLTLLGDLGTDSEGYSYAEAKAINAAGVAVGNAQKYDAAGNYLGYWAVKWEASGTAATPLGHLGELANNPSYAPNGFTESQAFAINQSGTVVGYSNVYDASGVLLRPSAPVRWDAAGTPTELESPSPHGATVVWSPTALNDAGTAVGWSTGFGAVRWDASGTAATLLGTIDPADNRSGQAWAINGAGTAVGWAFFKYVGANDPLDTHAVYWGLDAQAVDLNTLINPNSGWVLNRASGISDTGWIVGLGMFDPDGAGGQVAYPRHFLMHVPATAVPEPASLAVFILGAPLLVCRNSLRKDRNKIR